MVIIKMNLSYTKKPFDPNFTYSVHNFNTSSKIKRNINRKTSTKLHFKSSKPNFLTKKRSNTSFDDLCKYF